MDDSDEPPEKPTDGFQLTLLIIGIVLLTLISVLFGRDWPGSPGPIPFSPVGR